MLKYTVGADPELFLVGTDGKYKSAHNIIPGSKHDPMPVMCGAIQPDGVAAEFNINPAANEDEFVGNIRGVLTELQERIESKNKGLSLIVSPTATFDKGYFNKLPKKAKLLGCEPDYNVYTGKVNPPPETKLPFRTGAGHIHVGWTEGMSTTDDAHVFDCSEMVKQLDSVLYPMSLLWDPDERRRDLYGLIGTYRPKHYGVEYRPLSNAWVADPDLQRWVFKATNYAAEMLDGDIKFWQDYVQQGIVSDIRGQRKLDRLRLLEYHDYLSEEFAMPKMPEPYIRIHD